MSALLQVAPDGLANSVPFLGTPFVDPEAHGCIIGIALLPHMGLFPIVPHDKPKR